MMRPCLIRPNGKKKPPAFAGGWSHPLFGGAHSNESLETVRMRSTTPVDVMVLSRKPKVCVALTCCNPQTGASVTPC